LGIVTSVQKFGIVCNPTQKQKSAPAGAFEDVQQRRQRRARRHEHRQPRMTLHRMLQRSKRRRQVLPILRAGGCRVGGVF